MSGLDELLTIAEIAVTLAGFAGVVAAFLHRGGLHPVDQIRFVNLFVIAFSAVVLAFIPIALSHLGVDAGRLWATSSWLMIGAWAVHMVAAPPLIRRLRRELTQVSFLPISLLLVPAFLNLGVQLLNAIGWPRDPGFVPYLFGLFVYLYSAGVSFVYAVVFRPAEDPGADA